VCGERLTLWIEAVAAGFGGNEEGAMTPSRRRHHRAAEEGLARDRGGFVLQLVLVVYHFGTAQATTAATSSASSATSRRWR
jgi:hypothetical protein